MEDDLKKIVQPKTIKSKNNDCGTAPGNLVSTNLIFQNKPIPYKRRVSGLSILMNIK